MGWQAIEFVGRLVDGLIDSWMGLVERWVGW